MSEVARSKGFDKDKLIAMVGSYVGARMEQKRALARYDKR
jgi:hypothetical protein